MSEDRARLSEGVRRALRRPWALNEATRLALDAFAARYAATHGLAHRSTGETPPATWFLETVVPAKSHSSLAGDLGAETPGELFYVERVIPVKRGQVMEGWTVALVRLPDAARLLYGLACVFRLSAPLGARPGSGAEPPRGLSELSSGDALVDERFLVAVSEDDAAAARAIFTAGFVAWLRELPWRPTGDGVTRFELRNGALCVYMKGKARSADALDALRERTVHIAGRISEVAGERKAGQGQSPL